MTTIRSKIMIATVATFVLASSGAGAGLWGAMMLTRNVENANRSAAILRNHMQADMMHDALRADAYAALLGQNPDAQISFDDVKAEIAEHIAGFRAALDANRTLAGNGPIRDILTELDAPLAKYIEGAGAIVDMAPQSLGQAFGRLPAFKAEFLELETAMEKAADAIEGFSDDIGRASEKTSAFIDMILKGCLAATAVFALALLLISQRTIIKPIRILAKDMQALAAGQTDLVVTASGRKDEIGEMAAAVEVFRQAAISNKTLEAMAVAERERNEADRGRQGVEAEEAARIRLQTATSDIAAGLRRLADGDLTFELSEPLAADFEALRHDLNAAVRQLDQTLSSVAHAAESINSGTREISLSSDDLAKRTERQAASLEQTASALDQITVNVSNASKRTEEARSVAIQANTSAAHSGAVVANAVDAMNRIEQSSSQISNIIGVIDEIAFQTNLLALNAGVEAARAGDAGKGFAVVAQEVRELAQRSAKAAKEIKDLIRNSNVEVESGVKLVSETGDALKTIEQYIVIINQHMEAIATSSREQSVGLAEVNKAVNQMDQVTQQNAAMVEETNAASATLADEGRKLQDLIAGFQLGRRTAEQGRGQKRQRAA